MAQVPRADTSCTDTIDSQVLSRAQTPSATQMGHGNQSWRSGSEDISSGGREVPLDLLGKKGHKVDINAKVRMRTNVFVPLSQFFTAGLR